MLIHPKQGPGFPTRPAPAGAGPATSEPVPTESFAPGESAPPKTLPALPPEEKKPKTFAHPANPDGDWILARRVGERKVAMAELARPDGAAALPWLRSSDGQIRHLAMDRYGSSTEGLNELDRYVAARGSVEGAAAHLRLKTMFVSKHYSLEDAQLAPTLDLLDAAVRREGKASENALQALLQATRNLAGRARDFEVEKPRQEEAAGFSARAGQMLSDWWRDGLCEIPGQKPGSLPLAAMAARDKLTVRDNRLAPRRAPGGEADEIISQNNPSILVTRLNRNPAAGAVLAGELVREVVARADEPGAIRVLAGLLSGCHDNPQLTEAFRPHVEAMRTLFTEGQALGVLGPESVHSVGEEAQKYLRELGKAFPEVADERFVRQLEPLFFDTNASSADMTSYGLKDLWKQNPELVLPSVQMVMHGVDSGYQVPPSGAWRLLAAAGEAGWQPDKLERDWMVNWLATLPDDREPERLALWSSGSFEPGLQALATFVRRDPKFLDGLSLPDRLGRLEPVSEALVDHLLQTPGSDDRFTSDRDAWPGHLFTLIAPVPDPALEKRLLAPLEAELEGRAHLLELTPELRTRFAVLGSMGISPETRARLDSLLEAAMPYDHDHLNDIVERFRGPRVEAFMKSFEAPKATTEERLEAARGALALSEHHTHRIFAFHERMRGALDGLAPEAAKSLETQLADRLSMFAGRGLSLDQLSPEGLCDVHLGAYMAKPSLLGSLRQLLPAEGARLDAAQERVGHQIRFRLRDANDKLLAETGRPESERFAAIEDNVQLAEAYRDGELPERSLQAWSEHATGWVKEACEDLGETEALRSVRVLITEQDPADLLHEVQGRLKGGLLLSPEEIKLEPEAVSQALEDYRASRLEGWDREAALNRVLGAVSASAAPVSTGVQVTDDHVGVGAVRLRRRV